MVDRIEAIEAKFQTAGFGYPESTMERHIQIESRRPDRRGGSEIR